MTTTQMVAVLDAEMARLRQVRELLAGAAQGLQPVKAKGPRVASGMTAAGAEERSGRKKRTMSPEARERIAAAQRARWAAHTAASEGKDEAAPKRGRGRPKKDSAAKKSVGRSSGAPPEEGAEGTA